MRSCSKMAMESGVKVHGAMENATNHRVLGNNCNDPKECKRDRRMLSLDSSQQIMCNEIDRDAKHN